MRQFIKKISLVILIIFFFFPIVYYAKAEIVSEQSAKFNIYHNISNNNKTNDLFLKTKSIENILIKYQSPLVNNVSQFIYICQKYQLDCYLLPSIAGLESTFGRFIYPQSFNPFGWGGGYIMFKDWNESIEIVAKGLRENYLNQGADTVEKIGVIYSESPTWAQRVKFIMGIFLKEEKRLEYLFTNKNLSL